MKNENEEKVIPTCMRCGHDLVEVESELTDETGEREYHCPYCGTIELFYPCDEEDRDNYAYYNKDIEDDLGGSSHGYDGFCPQCGSHIVWGADFMRSEILGDVDEDEVDEYGCPVDDSLASNVYCPHCGASIDIVEPKPSECDKYPAYKEKSDD